MKLNVYPVVNRIFMASIVILIPLLSIGAKDKKDCGGELSPSYLAQKAASQNIGEAPFAQNFSNAVEKHKKATAYADAEIKKSKATGAEREEEYLRLLIEGLVAMDVRQFYFRIQGLSRVFTDLDKRTFEGMRGEYKSFEDILGKISMFRSLKLQAEKFGMTEVEGYFYEQENIKAAEGISTLSSELNLTDPSKEFEAALKKIDSSIDKSSEDLISFVFNFILERFEKVIKAIKNRDYDNADVEKGLHELRRALRWLQIFITSFPGFFKLVDVPLDSKLQKFYGERKRANPQMESSQFLKLPEPKIEKPILGPLQHFTLLTDMIEDIGRRKDLAETTIFFHQAIDAIPGDKASKDKMRRDLAEKLGVVNYNHQAESVMQMELIEEVGLLESYLQNLKDLNPGIKIKK